jgi:hypothetical protein
MVQSKRKDNVIADSACYVSPPNNLLNHGLWQIDIRRNGLIFIQITDKSKAIVEEAAKLIMSAFYPKNDGQ